MPPCRHPVLAILCKLFIVCLAAGGCADCTTPAAAAEKPAWRAVWITAATGHRTAPEGSVPLANTWAVYRHTFTLTDVPSRIEAHIAVDSKYWLKVNGRDIVFEGGLKRGPNPRDSYYDTLELGPHLQPGKNTIEVLAWFFGRDGFAHKNSGRAGLLLELLDPATGALILATDATWQAALHPAWSTARGEQPNFRLAEASLRYDARRTLTDSDFTPAIVLGPAGAPPWGALHPRPIPLWHDSGLMDYASIDGPPLPRLSDGETFIARLPYNAQITPYLEIEAAEGTLIDIRTDHYRGGGEPGIRAEYVAREGLQTHESLGWINGHEVRYSIPAGVMVRALKYRETHYATTPSGIFATDDAFLDRLWEKSRRTLLLTMRDNYMDCPDRERAQWWGDAVIQLGQSFYAFSPSATPLAAKAIRELCDWQRTDGSLFSPIPAGNWDKELSQQMLASVGLYGFWTYYLYSGDRDTAIASYPHVRAYLALWQLDANDLVAHRPGGWDWADWGGNIDVRLLDQGWYCLALDGAASLARLAGQPQDADEFLALRARVISAVNRHYWRAETEVYRSDEYRGPPDDRGHGLAVLAGIAGAERYPSIRRLLASTRHASPYLEKYILEALLIMDEDPTPFLTRLKERYAGIVADDCSTLPELWTTRRADPGPSTLNHSWTGGPLTLLSQYIAGLSPQEPGWSRYLYQPRPGPLRRIDAAVESAAGLISTRLRLDQNALSLELTSPPDTTAELHLPLPTPGGAFKIHLDGQPLTITSAVSVLDHSTTHVRLLAQPGQHRLTILPAEKISP